MLGLGILLLTFLVCLFPIQSNDLFMYLAVGNYHSAHGQFPIQDPFLYSIPAETLYWHHHWLGAQIFFWVEQLLTLDGVIVFKALLAMLLPMMALLQWRKHSQKNGASEVFATLLILLALMISSYRFIERTSLFSDLLTCFVLWLGLRERNQKPKWMWLLPLLFVLWINLHPGFPLGIALVGFFWLFENESLHQKLKSPKLLILALSVLALFLNPEGWNGILYPFLFSQHQGQVYKQFYFEWLPAYSEVYRGAMEALGFFLLSAVSLSIAWMKRGKDSRLLLILIFVALGLSAVRFFNVASFALVILCLDFEFKFPNPAWARFLPKAFAVLLLGLMLKVIFLGYQTSSGPRHLKLGIDENLFPVKIAAVYEEAHLRGNIFNTHTFGDYLAWRWNGNPKIYFHGANLNTDFYLHDYREAAASEADFDHLSQKYQWTVLFVSRYENPNAFFQILSKKPEWKQGAEDAAGFLFFKDPEARPPERQPTE